MTEIPEITLACFGLIGTLVNDDGALELAFAEAIATQGVVSGTSAYARAMAQIHRARGQAPADILRDLFPENLARAQAAHLAFDRSLAAAVERRSLTPIPGAVKVLTDLAEAGCRICLVTSLPRRELTGMLRTMRWRELLTAAFNLFQHRYPPHFVTGNPLVHGIDLGRGIYVGLGQYRRGRMSLFR